MTDGDDTFTLFTTSILREQETLKDLRACMDTLGAVITRSDVLAPLRNEIATRTYDLAVLQHQRDRYVETGSVIDITVIREEYAQKIRNEFLCERVEKEPLKPYRLSEEQLETPVKVAEHSGYYYSRCPACHSDVHSVMQQPCLSKSLPHGWHHGLLDTRDTTTEGQK